MTIKTIVSPIKLDCEHLLGKFLDKSHYDTLVEEDCDFYAPPGIDGVSDESNIIFKFRKNVFPLEVQQLAYDNLKASATRTENRGLASGVVDGGTVGEGMQGAREFVTNYQDEILNGIMDCSEAFLGEFQDPILEIRERYPDAESRRQMGGRGKGYCWVIYKFRGKFDFDAWVDTLIPMSITERKTSCREVMKMLSDSSYGLPVNSGVVGFMDRYPRLPYARATSYMKQNPEAVERSLPFFQLLSKCFKMLLPDRYAAQKAAIDAIDNRFTIPKTVFTTITVNKNFRTAAHRDAGDLNAGYSNLTVVGNGINYDGGYLILPEFRAAVNIRPGDLLLINNHAAIHANTELSGDEGFERVSFVCYFREKLLDAGTKEYEDCRYDFIEQRRKNPDHPNQRHLWNGITPGCWETTEWFDYLREKLGEETLRKYHPEVLQSQEASTLSDFFG